MLKGDRSTACSIIYTMTVVTSTRSPSPCQMKCDSCVPRAEAYLGLIFALVRLVTIRWNISICVFSKRREKCTQGGRDRRDAGPREGE